MASTQQEQQHVPATAAFVLGLGEEGGMLPEPIIIRSIAEADASHAGACRRGAPRKIIFTN